MNLLGKRLTLRKNQSLVDIESLIGISNPRDVNRIFFYFSYDYFPLLAWYENQRTKK
jgi:hypothetical protein